MKPPEHNAKSAPTSRTLLFAGPLRLRRRERTRTSVVGVRGACSIHVAFALVVLSVCVLAFSAAPVFAAQVRVFTGSFGGGVGSKSTVVDPYPLHASIEHGSPWSVAVDQATGDVYASDQENHRVEKFGPTGEFLLMFGKEVNANPVAADRDVCTALETCQAGTGGATPGALEGEALYLAVDSSSGESKDDVYVGELGANIVQKFDSSGTLISGWGKEGQLDGSSVTAGPGAPLPGPFNQLNGIAVDASGSLWVYGTANGDGAVFEFKQDSSFAGNDWSTGKFTALGLAVNSLGDVYVAEGVNPTEEFDATGTPLCSLGVGAQALAADSAGGDVYAAVGTVGDFSVLTFPGSGCAASESFSSGHLSFFRGLAVNSAHAGDPLYAAELEVGEVGIFSVVTVPDVLTVKASGFASGVATLNGTVDPAGVELNAGLGGCRFEWGETEAPYEHAAPCAESAAQIGSGSAPVAVHAEVSGLQQGHTYHFRLVAGNANDVNGLINEPSQGGDLAFGPPLLRSESVAGVSSSAATFGAVVNPNNVDTHLRFEYGTEAGVYGPGTSEVDLGAGASDVIVSPHVQGLVSGTVYHYRVVVESALGTVEGVDRTFRTQASGSGVAGLPDGRVWELVSPADKDGASVEPIVGEDNFAIQAAAGGGAISYVTTAATEPGAAGNSNRTEVFSGRSSAGWASKDIASPHVKATGVSLNFQEYRLFSDDLSAGLLAPFGAFDPAVSPEASEQTPFLRDDLTGSYRPLVTASPGFANVLEGTEFGVEQNGGGKCPPNPFCGPEFLGASPDLKHVVFSSRVPLVEDLPTGAMYEWTAGRLTPASVLRGGAIVGASAGAKLGRYLPYPAGSEDVRHAVSVDGSRVVWSTENPHHLYLRDMASEETVQLDAGLGAGTPVFQDASSDDSKVLFSDAAQLEQCEVIEEPGNLHCNLSSVGPLTGTVIGASEDGSFVYFVSSSDELVVSHDGVTSVLAALSGEDGPDWGGQALTERLTHLTARVSPDGRWVAFSSQESLTGYDNHDAASGQPDEELFLYHAAGGGSEPTLVCASCNLTGARPHGEQFEELHTGAGRLGLAGGGGSVWPASQWLAANTPTWTSSFYQSRYLSDGGRLFFNTSDALVPQDTNNTEDVYQYEPPNGPEAPAGDTCATQSATFSTSSGGCVSLISSGTSPQESAFLDASETGQDIFFLTTAKLTPEDTDTALDIYDAHACTSGSPCPPPPPPPTPACVGDACQAPAVAREHTTPGSLTFHGPGDPTPAPESKPPPTKPKTTAHLKAEKLKKALKACRKDKSHKKRVACEKQARKKYGAKTAKKSTTQGAR